MNEVVGEIVATKAPTCGASRLDCFVVSRQLGQGVAYIKRLTGFGTAPHYPVRIAIRAGMRRLCVRAMVAPKKVPALLPQGCLEEKHCMLAAAEESRTPEEGGSGANLEGRIKEWYTVAEEVWADIAGKDGEERTKMLGRAKGPRFVWKCALGPPADSTMLSTKAARSWKKLEGWCDAIKLACTHRHSKGCVAHPLWEAARVARRKIAAAAKWSIGDAADNKELLEFTCAAKTVRWDDTDQVVAMAAWAQGQAVSMEGKALRKEKVRYSEWLKSGPAEGLARQHAATKSVGQWTPSKMVKLPRCEDVGEGEEGQMLPRRECTSTAIQADGEVGVPANIQQEVEMETCSWAAHWWVGSEAAAVEWPRDMEQLPPITVQELRVAAAQFKEGVELGGGMDAPKGVAATA